LGERAEIFVHQLGFPWRGGVLAAVETPLFRRILLSELSESHWTTDWNGKCGVPPTSAPPVVEIDQVPKGVCGGGVSA